MKRSVPYAAKQTGTVRHPSLHLCPGSALRTGTLDLAPFRMPFVSAATIAVVGSAMVGGGGWARMGAAAGPLVSMFCVPSGVPPAGGVATRVSAALPATIAVVSAATIEAATLRHSSRLWTAEGGQASDGTTTGGYSAGGWDSNTSATRLHCVGVLTERRPSHCRAASAEDVAESSLCFWRASAKVIFL